MAGHAGAAFKGPKVQTEKMVRKGILRFRLRFKSQPRRVSQMSETSRWSLNAASPRHRPRSSQIDFCKI